MHGQHPHFHRRLHPLARGVLDVRQFRRQISVLPSVEGGVRLDEDAHPRARERAAANGCLSPAHFKKRPAPASGSNDLGTLPPFIRFPAMGEQVEKCRRKAVECESTAQHSTNEAMRRAYLELAQLWRHMAAQAETLDRRSSDLSIGQH
jgi:hypothetical protein